MAYHYSTYSLVLFIATLITIFVISQAWKKRDVPGGKYFFFLMLSVSTWTFTGAFEMAAVEPAAKILWSKFSYLGSTTGGTLLFLFVLAYTQRDYWLSPKIVAALWIIPAITLSLAATNEYHGLIWPKITPLTDQPGSLLIYDHGFGVWLIMSYSYLFLLLGAIIIIQSVLRAPQLYKKQAYIFVLGILFPFMGSFLYLSKLSPFPGFDLTPVGFTITGLLMIFLINRYQFLDIVPIAHDALFQSMDNGVFVTDANERIVDLNPAACRMFCVDTRIIGKKIGQVIENSPAPLLLSDKNLVQSEITISGGNVFLEVFISPILNRDKKYSGNLLIFQNITARKKAELALRESEERWKFALEGNGDGVIDWDIVENKVFLSARWKEMFGYRDNDLPDNIEAIKNLVYIDDKESFFENFQRHLSGKTRFYQNEHRILCKDGSYKWILDRGKVMLRTTEGNPLRMIATFTDISERKIQEKEREDLIDELKKALSEIKTLRGFIPICSHCKKIRTDKGYWEQIEEYISDHSDAEFTHSVCPECMELYYKDIIARKNRKTNDDQFI